MGIGAKGQVMLLRMLCYVVWTLLMGAWGWGPVKCGDVYQQQVTEVFSTEGTREISSLRDPGKLLRQTTELSEVSPETFTILRNVLRVFNEYPRDWVVREKGYTEVSVPAGRWMEIFKVSYQEVVMELQSFQIFRTNTFTNGLREVTQEGPFLLDYSVRRLDSGEEVYTIKIDVRLVKLYDFHLEPAIVSLFLEDGLLMNRQF